MILFRPMQERDLDPVTALEKASFSRPWGKNDFADALKNENYIYYVAEQDGEVVANAGLILSFEVADLTNVATREGYRGRGIACGLLTELMRAGREKGVTDFTLEVRAGNLAAVRLYEKMGFVCEGRRKRFYTAPVEDALIYWCHETGTDQEQI